VPSAGDNRLEEMMAKLAKEAFDNGKGIGSRSAVILTEYKYSVAAYNEVIEALAGAFGEGVRSGTKDKLFKAPEVPQTKPNELISMKQVVEATDAADAAREELDDIEDDVMEEDDIPDEITVVSNKPAIEDKKPAQPLNPVAKPAAYPPVKNAAMPPPASHLAVLGCDDCGNIYRPSSEAQAKKCPKCDSPRVMETRLLPEKERPNVNKKLIEAESFLADAPQPWRQTAPTPIKPLPEHMEGENWTLDIKKDREKPKKTKKAKKAKADAPRSDDPLTRAKSALRMRKVTLGRFVKAGNKERIAEYEAIIKSLEAQVAALEKNKV